MQDAPVEEIAKAVGIARGLIYRQFSSKEELFVLTVTDYLAELEGVLRAAVAETDAPAAQLERTAEAYAGFIARVYAMRGTDWRMLPIEANGQSAVAAYVGGRAHTVQVFEVAGAAIARTVVFQDETLFTAFGLPPILPG